jgi:hypothetical protein
MALDWVKVCNMALRRIGTKDVISSLNGTDKASITCNDAYEAVRDATLEDFDWKCASWREALSKDPIAPVVGWLYKYNLPSTPWCLVVREIYPESVDYEIEGRTLLSDYDNAGGDLYIRYTRRLANPAELSTLCAKAIAWRLAAEICYHFVQSSTLQQTIFQEYQSILEEAKLSNQTWDKNHDEDPSNGEWIRAGR